MIHQHFLEKKQFLFLFTTNEVEVLKVKWEGLYLGEITLSRFYLEQREETISLRE